MSVTPVVYLQTDPQWSSLPFTSHNDLKQTIGSSGCGVTCMAMVLATFLNDHTIKPDFTAKLCVDNGYRTYNQGTDFAFFPFAAQKYGVKLVESSDTNDLEWALQHNGLIICSMKPGYFTTVGHFILAYDINEDNILVLDPAYDVNSQYHNHLEAPTSIFKTQCQRYFIFYKQEAAPMTVDEAKQIIKQKAGLSDESIQFLYDYRYGDDLLIKLATAMS